ncbi:hypothetical protein [Kribbella pratensis]|uniref:hypothetical protein n=1 Tax=Kribbella pratensis TaxID=2512112 RepID=UPI001065FF2E|nr:hypothetical protein [Kribbella pratensis]
MTDHYRYEPSVWVRSIVEDDLLVRLATELTRPCPHLTDPEHQRYAYALWAPDLLLCADCIGPVMDAPAGMCDRCGEAQAAHQNDYIPTTDGEGWVLLFRLCEDCQRREMSQ